MDKMELDPNPSPPSRASSHRSRRSNLSLDLSNIPLLLSSTKRAPQPTKILILAGFPSLAAYKHGWENPFDQNSSSSESLRKLVEWLKKPTKKVKDEAETKTETDTETEPNIKWTDIIRLTSFSRIMIYFEDAAMAKTIRECWENEEDFERPERFPECKVFYGTPHETASERYLALPDAGQLWFISPPPSPPHGWEARREDPPNTMVHAEDLAAALAQLHSSNTPTTEGVPTPVSPADSKMGGFRSGQRSRSSTLIFQPQPQMGNSPDMPCVIVDDMTDEPFEMNPLSGEPKKRPITHTTRPGLELVHHA